jgi:hypothetical protein
MKTLPYLAVVLLLASCAPYSLVSTDDSCLDLTSLKHGKVKFMLNKDKYPTYPRNYVVLVYDSKDLKNLVETVFLPKDTQWEKEISVKQDYCVVVLKDRFIGNNHQMEWDNNPKKVSALNNTPKTYLASTSTSKWTPVFFTTITSKDGAAGEGVKAVVD